MSKLWAFLAANRDTITALATLAMAVFTGTLWWSTTRMQHATEQTLVHLRQQFVAEQRPWIPAEIQLASGWSWTPEGEGRVTLRFALRNIGRSPATNVDVRTEIFPLGWGFPDPPAAQKKLAESERGKVLAPGEGMGFTIFPQTTPRYLDITMSISAAQFEQSRLAWKTQFPDAEHMANFVTPVIVGAITYRFVGEQHQTGFIVQLSRVDPANPRVTLTLDRTQTDIPIERLRLADYYVGSAVID